MGYLGGNEFPDKKDAQVKAKYLSTDLLQKRFKYSEMTILDDIKL